MKKKYCYLTAIALLGLAACSEDMDSVNGGINNGGASALNGRIPLTFRLDGLTGGAVPYSRADIALGKENEIRTLDVFVFGKDTLPDGTEKPTGKLLLEEVFRSGVSKGIELTVDGAVQKAELSVLGRNRKRLYFVANGRDHAVLNKFVVGETDTLAFRDGVTDALVGHISCPLLMTTDKGLSVTDSVTKHGTDLTWAANIPISLKRRMARFDIVNTGADSQFFIEWIQLQNARKQNYLFEDAAHTTPYFATSELFDPERIDFKSQDNANNGETLASFYVYAAEQSGKTAAPAKDFSLVLGGKSGSTGTGTAVLYPVLMRTTQEDGTTALEVKANNRYVINIKSVGSNVITADIKVNEWLTGDTVKVESGYGIFGLSMPVVDPKGTMVKNTLTLTSADADADILVDVAADTEWEVVTDCDWIDLTGTPAAGDVGKTLTFATTKANPRKDASRIGRIIFRNKMRPSITQTLLVEQPMTTGDFLHVNVPTKVTGLSVEGDTIRLSGGVEKVVFPLSGSDLTAASASFDKSTIATAVLNATENTVELTMEDNTTGADRKGVLTVTAGTLEQKFNIVQKSKSLGMIVLTGSGIIDRVITLGAADIYDETITVAASSAWTFDGVADATSGTTIDGWVTLSDATNATTGNGSFKLTTTANDTYDAREAVVKIVNTKNAGISSMLTVKQAAKPETITASATGLTGSILSVDINATSVITVAVTANLKAGETWEVAEAGTTVGTGGWLTVGTVSNGEFELTPTDNSGGAERSVDITIQKVGDTNVKQVITVTQAGV